MGTRSTIGLEYPDGTVRRIYCHWDGYPDNNGKILVEHYTTPEKISALLDLGDLSSLGAEIGEKHDFDARPDGQCTAYGRDRGEDDTEARFFEDSSAFFRAGQEYDYLFRNGEWWMTGHDDELKTVKSVIEEFEAEDEL